MSTLGNILWFIIGGWWNFLVYAFLGILFSITIIGIPIGKALFQYAKLMVSPFGKVIISETELKGKENVAAVRRVGGMIANLIWLPVGIIMFIGNILLAVATAITIIGIPVAIVLVRSAKFLIWPVGAKVITKEQAEMLRMERTMIKVMGTATAINQSMMQQRAEPSQYTVPPQDTASPASQASQQMEYFGTGNSQTADTGKICTQSATAAGTSLTLESFIEKSEQAVNGLREKLLQNQVMVKLMPYLDYLALGILVLDIIASFVLPGWPIVVFILGMLVVAAEGLEIIKGNRLLVLILLGSRLILRLIWLWILFKNSYGLVFWIIFSTILLLIHLAVLVWYILVFVRGKDPVIVFRTSSETQMPSAGGNSGNSASVWGNTAGAATTAGKIGAGTSTAAQNGRFCSQCGTEYTLGARFCPKCGSKII